MKNRRPAPPQETRADVARRRLEQLTATFEATHGPSAADRSASRIQGERDADLELPGSGREPSRHDDVPPDARSAGGTGARPGRRRAATAPSAGLHATHLRVLATIAVGAGVVLTWWLLAERPRTADVDEPLTVSARSDAAVPDGPAGGRGAATSDVVVVDVAGKVRRPGIVTLPAGSRVYEAIEKAGGATGDGEGPAPNLARVLVDGEQILVGVEPAAPDAAVAGVPASGGGAAGGPVNLNTATLEQLDTLPGVGPVTAGAIVDWRTENGPFGAVDDLLDVPGIGDKTLDQLRDLVTV